MLLPRSARFSILILTGAVLAGCAAGPKTYSTYRPSLSAAAATVSAPGAATAQPAEGALSLKESVRLALANNRRVSVADRRVLIERDRRIEAIGSVLPRITG